MHLSEERSKELRDKLLQAQEMIMEVDVEVSAAYGKSNRPYEQGLAVAVRRLVFARAKMEQRSIEDRG